MAVNYFVYVLLLVSVVAMSWKVDTSTFEKRSANLPTVKFDEAIMYTMDEKEVTRIVKANQALRYTNKDEMYEANFVMRTNEDAQTLDIISAKKVIKKGNKLHLQGDVEYNRGDNMQFKSKVLNYDLATKIAQNKHPFWGLYNGNEFTGKNLYVDTNTNTILADKTKFIIVEDTKK